MMVQETRYCRSGRRRKGRTNARKNEKNRENPGTSRPRRKHTDGGRGKEKQNEKKKEPHLDRINDEEKGFRSTFNRKREMKTRKTCIGSLNEREAWKRDEKKRDRGKMPSPESIQSRRGTRGQTIRNQEGGCCTTTGQGKPGLVEQPQRGENLGGGKWRSRMKGEKLGTAIPRTDFLLTGGGTRNV